MSVSQLRYVNRPTDISACVKGKLQLFPLASEQDFFLVDNIDLVLLWLVMLATREVVDGLTIDY